MTHSKSGFPQPGMTGARRRQPYMLLHYGPRVGQTRLSPHAAPVQLGDPRYGWLLIRRCRTGSNDGEVNTRRKEGDDERSPNRPCPNEAAHRPPAMEHNIRLSARMAMGICRHLQAQKYGCGAAPARLDPIHTRRTPSHPVGSPPSDTRPLQPIVVESFHPIEQACHRATPRGAASNRVPTGIEPGPFVFRWKAITESGRK